MADQPDLAALLAAYDDQLRDEAETPGASEVVTLGPLRLATYGDVRGFVTYRDLAGADAATIQGWVGEVLEHYRSKGSVDEVEWKTRGHDRAPGLHAALVAHGFEPGEPESIMIGEARLLDVEVPLPAGVTLRQVTSEPDVRAMSAMQDEAFGDPTSTRMADELLARLSRGSGGLGGTSPERMQLWVAEAEGRIVSAGRLEPVAGTDFAGIWGGATLVGWRGRGIYRALTAARAHSALALGKTLVNSDSTEYSRPILERSGLVKVSTTTPYEWHR